MKEKKTKRIEEETNTDDEDEFGRRRKIDSWLEKELGVASSYYN